MINREDFLSLNYYIESNFYGSFGKMHYRISRLEKEEPHEEGEEVKKISFLHVWYWPGPYNFKSTDDNLKQEAEFPFSEEGICAVADFLNAEYEKQPELWE